MSSSDWTTTEKRLVIAAGAAPLFVSIALAMIGARLFDGDEPVFFLVALVPLAYITLFAFVLPSLLLLRRFAKEAVWSFSLVCGASAVVPWFLLYVAFFGEPGSAKYGGAPLNVLALLSLAGAISAGAAAIVYALFGTNRPANRSDVAR